MSTRADNLEPGRVEPGRVDSRGLDARAADSRGGRSALLGEVLRFCGVGVFSYGLGILLAAAFHEISGLRPEAAVGLSLAIILTTNFFLARRFIFRSSGRVHHEMLRFGITSAAMRGIEYMVFLALLKVLGINYLVSMTAAMLFSSCAKFVLYRKVVFRGSPTAR